MKPILKKISLKVGELVDFRVVPILSRMGGGLQPPDMTMTLQEPTLQKISLSEGELVNCRVMLIQPQGMTMKQLDIFHTKVMRKKTH